MIYKLFQDKTLMIDFQYSSVEVSFDEVSSWVILSHIWEFVEKIMCNIIVANRCYRGLNFFLFNWIIYMMRILRLLRITSYTPV